MEGIGGYTVDAKWKDPVEVSNSVEEGLKTLDQKLSEMISLQSTSGSKIVSFYGHYR